MDLPTISIVTPSFDQGEFLEEALLSVLRQGYPRLEYVVVDGGSSDQSQEIIGRYADQLSWWVSEKDQGQYDALNKGFARSTGEIMGWLNSDDKLLPWCLQIVGEVFATFPQVEWITSLFPLAWDREGRPTTCRQVTGFSRGGFMAGANLPGGDWPATDWIQQESTFWRRSLWERAGSQLNSSYRYAADFELWARFYAHGGNLVGVPLPLGGFRAYGNQKSAQGAREYFEEAKKALVAHGGKPRAGLSAAMLRKLQKAERSMQKRYRRAMAAKKQMINLAFCGNGGKWRLDQLD